MKPDSRLSIFKHGANVKQQLQVDVLNVVRGGKAQHLWRDLQMNNRPIAIYKGLVDRLGCVKSALLLSQMIYWTRKGVNVERDDGWFFKTVEEMMFETGLSRKEQLTAKGKLKALGILDFKMAGVPAVPYYRLNLKGLTQFVVQSFEIRTRNDSLTLADIRSVHGVFEEFLSQRLPYHTILANIAGGINAGLMLSFLFQSLFNGYSQKVQGFVTKSIEQWQQQTGLSYKEQRKARENLLHRGLIKERHFYLSREIFTEIQFDQCFKAFEQISAMRVEYVNRKIEQKRASLDVKKGVSSRTERSNTAVPKGEIQPYRKGEYSCAERSNTAVPKGQIQIYKTTKGNTTFENHIEKPQQPQCPADLKSSQSAKVAVVVVDWNKLKTQLHWPNCLKDPDDQAIVLKHLMNNQHRIDAQAMQMILDEVSGIEYSGKPIHNTIRYFGRLLSLYLMNQFVPELAHKVRKRREVLELRKAVETKLIEVEPQVVSKEVWRKNMDRIREIQKHSGSNRSN